MAQEKHEGEINGSPTEKEKEKEMCTGTGFKFNVHAQEFVPRSHSQTPNPGYVYPYFPFLGSAGGDLEPDWFYFADHEPIGFLSESHAKIPASSKNNNDVVQKIVKQVEYQFSDTNLVASDFLMKIMSKDPEGYVPMSVIASWKKIKSLNANNHMLIKALRTSTKLVVSEDGKKVRRKKLFTEQDKEELQSRTVVVENLPEDYSRQNLEKIFSVVGRVKNIRICHPQEPNASRASKGDVLIGNKLHALVEYETVDQAEKAVEKLNDERNWRKGLRVRSMLRHTPRSVIRNKRLDFDHFDLTSEDEQSPCSQTSGRSQNIEQLLEHNVEENQNGGKRGWIRGRGKPCVSVQSHNGRGLLSQTPQSGGSPHCEASGKQSPQGPKMPDGTRGFTMGRGKSPTHPLRDSPITPIGLRPIQL